MQQCETDVLSSLKRFTKVDPPLGMTERIICSARYRLFSASCARRRNVIWWAAICTVANVTLGIIALRTHQRNRSLGAALYGGPR